MRWTCSSRFHSQHHNKRRVKIQLAPANLHWCSDKALTALSDASAKYDAPMHMHLNETAYQKEYAWRRGECTALEYIDRFGMVNNRLTLGHGVWLNEKDIDRLAAAKGCVCHNCSSNFRLRSGVAALNFFEKKGINTAIGLDEAGINDDRDMLQELKLVLRAHRVPGMVEADVPTMAQVLRMATVGGAKTTPYGETIGSLEVGKGADMVLIDWDQVAYPYLDELTPTLDAVVQRAKNQAVTMTMCDGEVIYQDGKFTKVDRTTALEGAARRPRQGAGRRRGRAAQALGGVAAACAEVLRELHRHVEAPAVLPAELHGPVFQTRPGGLGTSDVRDRLRPMNRIWPDGKATKAELLQRLDRAEALLREHRETLRPLSVRCANHLADALGCVAKCLVGFRRSSARWRRKSGSRNPRRNRTSASRTFTPRGSRGHHTRSACVTAGGLGHPRRRLADLATSHRSGSISRYQTGLAENRETRRSR